MLAVIYRMVTITAAYLICCARHATKEDSVRERKPKERGLRNAKNFTVSFHSHRTWELSK